MRAITGAIAALAVGAGACGNPAAGGDAAGAGSGSPPFWPATERGAAASLWLSQTGLYEDIATKTLAPELHAFCCRARWLMFEHASWLMGIRGEGTLSALELMATSGNAPGS